MYRKMLVSITATMTAITMAAAPCVTSFAAEEVIKGDQTSQVNASVDGTVVEGNVAVENGPAVNAEFGSIEVQGDVTAENGSAVNTYSGNVEVQGDVTVENGPAVNAYSGSTDVQGDVAGRVNVSGGSVEISGNVTSNGDDSLLRVDEYSGNYFGNGTGLVQANGAGSTVNVGGNVDGSELISKSGNANQTSYYWNGDDEEPTSIVKYDKVTSTGGADSAVIAENGASVTVDGNVTGGKNGATVTGENSSLTVGGNVVSNGKESVKSGTKYTNGEGAEIVKETTDSGNTKYSVKEGSTGVAYADPKTMDGNGITTDGNGNILVKGDVTGTQNGITIDNDQNGKKGSITVLGTIKGEQYGINLADSLQMYKYVDNAKKGETAEESEARFKAAGEKLAAEIPEITVYAIEAKEAVNDEKLGVNSKGRPVVVECSDAYKAAYSSVVNAINYIIKHDDESIKDANVKVDATTKTIDNKDYYVTKINQAFSVAANLPDGFTLSGGDNVSVVDNGNGTFSLTLTNLSGGINIKAVLRPVSNSSVASSESSYEVEIQQVSQPSSTSPSSTETAAPVVIRTISPAAAAGNSGSANFVAAISGTKPAQTVSFEVGKITAAQYKDAVIANVASVPANGAYNIVTDKPSVFDSKMMDAIAARNDIDVNVVFNYGGRRYKVVIPAGYNVKSLLDSNGYCGFLRLLALLGGEVI